jgi:Ran GTPase-activating protein (RanGAP) involved in mRNA processing and transport
MKKNLPSYYYSLIVNAPFGSKSQQITQQPQDNTTTTTLRKSIRSAFSNDYSSENLQVAFYFERFQNEDLNLLVHYIMKHHTELHTLRLDGCNLNDSNIKILLPGLLQCSNLHLLSLSWNSWITDVGAEQIARLLINPNTKLHELDLSGNLLTSITAQTLANVISQETQTNSLPLTKLSLASNYISNQAGVELVQALAKHAKCLTHLNLSQCLIGDATADAIVNNNYGLKLTSLYVEGNDHLTDIGVSQLATLISRPHSTKLDNYSCGGKQITDVSAFALARAINENHHHRVPSTPSLKFKNTKKPNFRYWHMRISQCNGK